MISKPKKRKLNPMLFNVLLISGGLHILALLVLGGITIVKFVIPDEAQFEEPPEMVEEAPPPDVRVEIKPQAPPQQQAMRNLRMQQVGNIAVSAVDVSLPSMDESFTVSAGLGAMGGGGLLGNTRGSIGIGMSDVSVFGLKTRAERILFVIDANRQMVTDKKGGLNSYRVIKDEITDMVGNLSAGTLFNVMIVDRRRNKFFKPQLVPAGQEVHQQLIQWMRPINADANKPGLEGASGATRERLETLPEDPIARAFSWSRDASNENAFITQVALEQDVDAIFMITGYHRGFQRVRRQPTERENADWQRITSTRKYQEQLAEHQKEVPIMQKRIQAEMTKINAERKAKGLPARVLEQRHGVYSNVRELDLNWQTPHPGFQPAYFYEARELEKYFKGLIDVLYTDKGGVKPSVNVVLFLAGDEAMRKEWEDQLKDYVRFFGGKYRIIRGLDEIRSSRSAADTLN